MRMEREQVEQDIKFFEPPEIRGVSRSLLANLCDIVNRWGTTSPAKQVVEFRSGDLGNGLTLMVSRSVDPEKAGLIVARGDMWVEDVVFLETNLFRVIWDRGLAAKDAKEAVRRVDGKFREIGLVDSTGRRISLPAEQRLQRPEDVKRSAEFYTQNPMAVLVTMVDGRTEEQILAEFDSPEVLQIVFIGDIALVSAKSVSL